MRKIIAALMLPTLLLLGCGGEAPEVESPEVESPEVETPAAVDQAPDDISEDEADVPVSEALYDPGALNETAPPIFRAKFETTKGDFTIEVYRLWAPLGADRFYNLVSAGYYDGNAFFRVIEDFMVQFGINGDPEINSVWNVAPIKDDPVVESNTRGRVTFAMGGPDTRTTQMFINFGDNNRLDPMGFATIGEVKSGMEVVDSLYAGYGECFPRGTGPDQQQAQLKGNEYLRESFPELDYTLRATIIQ